MSQLTILKPTDHWHFSPLFLSVYLTAKKQLQSHFGTGQKPPVPLCLLLLTLFISQTMLHTFPSGRHYWQLLCRMASFRKSFVPTVIWILCSVWQIVCFILSLQCLPSSYHLLGFLVYDNVYLVSHSKLWMLPLKSHFWFNISGSSCKLKHRSESHIFWINPKELSDCRCQLSLALQGIDANSLQL